MTQNHARSNTAISHHKEEGDKYDSWYNFVNVFLSMLNCTNYIILFLDYDLFEKSSMYLKNQYLF